MDLLPTPHEASEFRLRILIGVLLLGLVFGALASRLWMLQVVRGEYYARCAAENGFKEREIAVVPHMGNDVVLWIDIQGQGQGGRGIRAFQ